MPSRSGGAETPPTRISGGMRNPVCSDRRNILDITSIALPGATARQLETKQVCQIKAGRFDLFQLDATD